MGREILKRLENPGANWVKLEVLGDSRSLLPDPIESLKATEKLTADGFEVRPNCRAASKRFWRGCRDARR